MKYTIGLLFVLLWTGALVAQPYDFQLAVLKYRGGGDYYVNPTAVRNLARFVNDNLDTRINPDYSYVEPSSPDLYNYPWVHMTGHGNVLWNKAERENLRRYLTGGGFLHIDDNYGMDPYIRRELQKLFPGKELQALPPSHPLFGNIFSFPEGLPKIHQHEGKPPAAYGIRIDGRLAVLYTHESDISDGWESAEVHNDPPEKRRLALQMGTNILAYAFGIQNR